MSFESGSAAMTLHDRNIDMAASIESIAPCESGHEVAAAGPLRSWRAGVALAFGAGIDRAVRRWRSVVDFESDATLSPALVDSWRDVLIERLNEVSSRALILELQIARLREQLVGSSPEERFTSFFQRLSRPARRRQLLRDYPELAHAIANAEEQWHVAGCEVVQHLRTGSLAIARSFAIDVRHDPLIALRAAGDRHRGGRCVLFAEFRSGRRLVYKPRPAALDRHFQSLLAWITAQDETFTFRTPRLCAAADHGWHEHVDRAACTAAPEAADYYRRQGEYLALLHVLDATDIHCENLIAVGGYPVLLDLEGLFHPARKPRDAATDGNASGAIRCANAALEDSVLRVNLLPDCTEGAASDATDFGGASAPARQRTPWPVLVPEAVGTDAMRLVRRSAKMQHVAHLPQCPDGSLATLADHAASFQSGFERMYALLHRHRRALLAPQGPLAAFTGTETRVILRPTDFYLLALQESLHPDKLGTLGERETCIGAVLASSTDSGDGDDSRSALADAEKADLLAGDVPLFTTQVGSSETRDSRGRVVRHATPGSEAAAHRKLKRLGPDDLEFQRWVIATSLARLGVRTGDASGAMLQQVHEPVHSTKRGERRERLRASAFDAARAVARRLERLAFRGADGATWLGSTAGDAGAATLSPLGGDLYDGLPGVALFLAYLGRIDRNEGLLALASAALATWQRDSNAARDSDRSIGGYTGRGGAMHALIHLGCVLGRPSLIDAAVDIATGLPKLVRLDTQDDIIGGAAGCLASLLALHETTGDARVMSVARACGDRLLARAVAQPIGIAWPGSADGTALGGFSHGSAGIGWALAALGRATGDTRYSNAARQARAHDDSLYCETESNWRDLRPVPAGMQPHPAQCRTQWCHGAAGIGLARLCDFETGSDEYEDGCLIRDITAASAAVSHAGVADGHCLCHGALGNLELLIQAELRFGTRFGAPDKADSLLESVLIDIEANGIRGGASIASPRAPGLMTGLAGIGYGLLRAARPADVPSLLLFQAPRIASKRIETTANHQSP